MTWGAFMRAAVVVCSLGGAGISCARSLAPSSGRDSALPPTGTWKTCAVARTLARQFTRAFVLLGEFPSYAENDRIVFHVCQSNDLDCNQASQPFPDACAGPFFRPTPVKTHRDVVVDRGHTARALASYVPVFIESRASDITVHVDLRFRFAVVPQPRVDLRRGSSPESPPHKEMHRRSGSSFPAAPFRKPAIQRS